MYLDLNHVLRRVKAHGQLAQLVSLAVAFFTVATLVATALTFLVMGFPQASCAALREALSDHRHW